jgi:PAS domain S-box-containing protein
MASPQQTKIHHANGLSSEQLASSEELLDALPDMMFRLDREGRYLQYKPAKDLEPMVPPEEFLGRTLHDIFPKDSADQALGVIEQVLETGESQAYDYELEEKTERRHYEARVVPLERGEVLAIVRYIGPVAKRKDARERYALTKRELAVLQSVAGGHTDKEVARRLDISPLTVRKHVASIRKKMGAQSRTEASVRALKDGLVS